MLNKMTLTVSKNSKYFLRYNHLNFMKLMHSYVWEIFSLSVKKQYFMQNVSQSSNLMIDWIVFANNS